MAHRNTTSQFYGLIAAYIGFTATGSVALAQSSASTFLLNPSILYYNVEKNRPDLQSQWARTCTNTTGEKGVNISCNEEGIHLESDAHRDYNPPTRLVTDKIRQLNSDPANKTSKMSMTHLKDGAPYSLTLCTSSTKVVKGTLGLGGGTSNPTECAIATSDVCSALINVPLSLGKETFKETLENIHRVPESVLVHSRELATAALTKNSVTRDLFDTDFKELQQWRRTKRPADDLNDHKLYPEVLEGKNDATIDRRAVTNAVAACAAFEDAEKQMKLEVASNTHAAPATTNIPASLAPLSAPSHNHLYKGERLPDKILDAKEFRIAPFA